MKRISFYLCMLLLFSSALFAQVSINTDGTQPDPSAGLDVKFNNKGFLPPRLSLSQIQTISNPANGLQVFCTTDSKMYIFIAAVNLWKEVAYETGTIVPPFTCGNPVTDSRDGKTYNTVQIGTQCWFKENLNIGTLIIGNLSQTNNSTIEKYCYNDIESNCTIYGGLYQWNEMMQYVNTEGVQGICPTDWHIPTNAQWTTLTTFIGAPSVGGKMKEAGYIHWASPNTAATNESGFTALPGGTHLGGSWAQIGQYGYHWSSTADVSYDAYTRQMNYNSDAVYGTAYMQDYGFSVRCLKN